MKTNRYTEAQIPVILRQAKGGIPVAELRRAHGMSNVSFCKWRGKSGTIRVDNGPEYISGKLMKWAENHGVTIQHIQPAQPPQNAYIERYNRTVRHEWLDQHIIKTPRKTTPRNG